MKRRDLYDGAPLLRDVAKWTHPWSEGPVAICGDAAHPMMPNLGQGGCQSTEDGYRPKRQLGTRATRTGARSPKATPRFGVTANLSVPPSVAKETP